MSRLDATGLFVVGEAVKTAAKTVIRVGPVGNVLTAAAIGSYLIDKFVPSMYATAPDVLVPMAASSRNRTFAYVNQKGEAIGHFDTASILQRLKDAAANDPTIHKKFRGLDWRRKTNREICGGFKNWTQASNALSSSNDIFVADRQVAEHVLYFKFFQELGGIRNETGWGPTESKAKYSGMGNWYHWDETFTRSEGGITHILGHQPDDEHGQIPHLQIHSRGKVYRLFYVR